MNIRLKRGKAVCILGLLGCLVLAGCGKKTEADPVSTSVSKAPPAATEAVKETSAGASGTMAAESEPEVWNPDVIQRQILVDEGAMCGVIFLGYVDESVGDLESSRESYQAIFEQSGYLESYPFLADVPASNFVQSEHGQELYCIIPEDTASTVSVNQWITDADKGFEGKTGEVLYRSEEGAPVLLRCNVSELVSDVEIVIVDGDGDVMRWLPSLSGMDGSVFVENANGAVWDFSVYNRDDFVDLLSVSVGQGFEYYWDEEYETTLAGLKYPVVKLEESDANAYPQLAENLMANMASRKNELYDEYKGMIEAARIDYPDMSEYFREYESSESAMVRRADSRVLSLLYNGFLYEGGVHGYYYYWGENYDTETGSLLKLTDVVNDISAFAAAVEEELYAHWEPEVFFEDFEPQQYFKENLDLISWTLDSHGVTVYFNPYDIAPYATGVQCATVAFDAKPELFDEKYTVVPDSYGVQVDLDIPFYYDVDGDGELDEILVYGIPNEYGYVVHNVHVDQECFVEFDEDAIYAYDICSPHMVHMEDGRNYLLIENQTDNDYRTNTIYELTSGTPVKVDHILAGMHTDWLEEDEVILKEVLTDPYSFRMDSRTWCVGTYDGYMTYYLDVDGFPVSYENYYTFESMPEFTAQKEFELKTVSEYGEVGETIVVKAGETVKYYRTDSSQFADFILPDGRIGRADLEWFEGSCSIGGSRVEELLSGIVFAG